MGRRSVLYLTNTDGAPATVDVALFTATGVQLPTPVQGVTLAPGTPKGSTEWSCSRT